MGGKETVSFFSILAPKGVKNIKRFKFNQKSIAKAIRTFSLSVGATAICMLTASGFLGPGLPAQGNVLEASAFNSSGTLKDSGVIAASSHEETRYVIPLGTTFGIKLFTDGVIVASLSDIYTETGLCCPAAEAGLRPGDYLLEADSKLLESNTDLARIIGASEGRELRLKVRREDEVFETSVTPVYGDGSFKTGMWVRDSAAGIGTLTFYDPKTGIFAGLGHGICDMDTSGIMALKSGEPAEITLCGITKGEVNNPGQLKGYFSSEEALGALLANNDAGVYGTLSTVPAGAPIEVLSRKDVKKGAVQLLCSLDQNGPQLYDAQIEKTGPADQKTKNLVIKVTDPRLLSLTGGIVQGMSGCPILQDGKLAGAVTHVFTEDPTTGYGIFAETMCEYAVGFGLSK